MKILVATIMFALAGPALAADDQKSPLYWTYQYVIATSDEELSVAQMVFDLPEMHPEMCDREMLDLLAEFLVNADVNDPSYRPGIKEIFSILEMRDAARYRTVASQVAHKSRDSHISTLAARYAKRHKENVPQYVPGTIDRAALRRQYARDALAARHPAELAVSLSTLPLNVGVERQFAIAGRPDAVVGYQRRMTDGLLIHIRTPYMFHYYRGIGRVTYQYKDGIGWLMRKVTINPLAFEPLMPYRDFAAELKLPDDETLEMTMLLSGDGPSAQTAAKNNHDRQKAPPRIIMDTTAELLLAKYQSPLEIDQRDAYGWFCRLLSHKGGPRYAKVLETVEAGAADEKLRRWAALPVEPAAGTDPTPYVPGSIKLADLASVYPAPYPWITIPRTQ